VDRFGGRQRLELGCGTHALSILREKRKFGANNRA
jgi:hypothetical protein